MKLMIMKDTQRKVCGHFNITPKSQAWICWYNSLHSLHFVLSAKTQSLTEDRLYRLYLLALNLILSMSYCHKTFTKSLNSVPRLTQKSSQPGAISYNGHIFIIDCLVSSLVSESSKISTNWETKQEMNHNVTWLKKGRSKSNIWKCYGLWV